MKYLLIMIGLNLLAGTTSADSAPLSVLTDNQGKSHNLFAEHQQADLIFIDALCPMPHFPGCEDFIESLAKTYSADQHNSYLIFNTLYVDAETVARFADKNHLTLPVVIDTNMNFHRQFSIHATPYQVVVTPSGEVTYRGGQLNLKKQ